MATSSTASPQSAVLHRSLRSSPLTVTSADRHTLNFSDGGSMLDSTCGAAVSCIGYGSQRVRDAMVAQLDKFAYVNSMFFSTPIYEELAAELIRGTEGKMARALMMCSGSEAMEAALKMARQYFVEKGELKRSKFIARESSYHGTTLGSLGVSGHVGRRALFEGTGMLGANVGRVSACYAYRGMKEGMTEEQYVQTLADELDRKFEEMDPGTVCAFIAEPVVGAVSRATLHVPSDTDLSRLWGAFPPCLDTSKP
jgi:adenosylmethionine-8-amino-7-oxononanoate aminotransferase